jgi:hypothetical protein
VTEACHLTRLGAQVDAVHLHRTGNVLDRLCAKILKGETELVRDLVANDPADADRARIGHHLESGRDVDAIAENVVAIDDDVADVDADPEIDSLLRRRACIALGHATLHVDCTAHSIDHAGKLQQKAIPGGLDDATTVLSDLWVDQFTSMGLQRRQRAAVVATH